MTICERMLTPPLTVHRLTWNEAMWRFEHTPGVDLTEFDQDGDGIFDCLVILHSGAAAETGGNDCK